MVKKKMILGILVCTYGIFMVSSAETDVTDLNEYAIISAGAASCGNNTVTGKACLVLKSKQLDKIRKGDIVIAPAIHSTWYPQLSIAAGIITEKGDESSNAIAFGKKLGISVIVGVDNATRLIVDGQTIICDPITRNIYHVGYSHSPEPHFDTLNMAKKDASYSVVHDKEKNKIVSSMKEKINVHSEIPADSLPQEISQYQNRISTENNPLPVVGVQNSRFKPISEQRILVDEKRIREYIKATESGVSMGQTFGKTAAYWAKGIASKTFDAMPVEFFKDYQAKEQSIRQLSTAAAIEYMEQGKKEFIERYLNSPKAELKINTIAGFLHDRMVDHLPIADGLKKLIKDQPLRITDVLKDAKVKAAYMNLTCQNMIIQCYIEKELGKEAT